MVKTICNNNCGDGLILTQPPNDAVSRLSQSIGTNCNCTNWERIIETMRIRTTLMELSIAVAFTDYEQLCV